MTAATVLETLLAPLSDQAPCGPDLEYDAEFMALERVAASRAERMVGDSVLAAEEPDWDKVRELALAVMQRSRDLRVATHLVVAWTRLRGLDGCSDGLALVHGLLERQWGDVHPRLDAEDDDDPTARVNALLALADPLRLLGHLRTAPFVQSPRLGRFGLRDLRIAQGSLKVAAGDDAALPSLAEIEACCLDCPLEQLQAAASAGRQALAAAQAIDGLLGERLGTASPDLKPLLVDLAELDRFLQPQWLARSGTDAALQAAGHDSPGEAGTGTAAVAAASGRIETPEDVRRRLDEICDYYARAEPSSPVPMLLRRAQRLIGKDFLDLLRDLAPGGVDELERVTGRAGE
jgi:type VI secretion system protein ImpA